MARQSKYGPYNYERILGGRNYSFTASVDSFVRETELRMSALVLQSVTELVEEVQTPVAKGGRMRVDTGFLRASGQLSLNGMPSGPERGRKREIDATTGKPETGIIYPSQDINAIVDLANWEIGQSIFFGWTANYAKYREAYDGFLISGIQNWQQIVNRVAAQIKARSPANRK